VEPKRFPKDFMFQLTKEDFEGLGFRLKPWKSAIILKGCKMKP
jgi:hypothetical protein